MLIADKLGIALTTTTLLAATAIAGDPWRDPERQAKLENDAPLAGDTAELP